MSAWPKGRYVSWLLAALALLGIGMLRAGLLYSQRYLSEWIAAHMGYDLRNRLYDHIQYLSFSYHDHTQTGQLISRVIEDVRAIERFTGFGVVEMIRVVLLLSVSLSCSSYISRAGLDCADPAILVLMLLTAYFGRRIGRLSWMWIFLGRTFRPLAGECQRCAGSARFCPRTL